MKTFSPGLNVIGMILVFVAVTLVFLLTWFLDALIDVSSQSCTCGDSCGMVGFEIPAFFYVGFFSVCILFFIGIYLLVRGKSIQKDDVKAVWSENLGKLDGDAKRIYELIMDSGGAIFQSEIVEKTGLSKVKVSRTLDRMESRQLLERRRRGLTNIVVLK